MSEAETTQPVVQTTEAPALPGAEVTVDARNDGDDLDTLLKEFDQHEPKPVVSSTTKPEPGQEPDLKALAQKFESVEGFVRQQSAVQYKQDMAKTVEAVRGDLPAEIFDDGMIESWLDGQARNDPRLAQAWMERNTNPKQFEKVKVALGKQLAQKFSKLPDRQVSEDRASVAAAVRGASTRAPEAKAPNFAALSDNDFQAEKDKLFGNS
jgi:hypothetical protein